MPKLLKLKPPQKPAIDFMLAQPRCAIFGSMGIGKTTSALLVVDLWNLHGLTTRPTLVLGPMRVIRDTWPEEGAKWTQTAHLRIVPLIGTPLRRAQLLQIPADVYTLSYENLPWLVNHVGRAWPFGQVIADESSRLKGYRMKGQGGERADAVSKVAHFLTDRWVNLTGTPAANGLKDLWGQTWFLDRGVRLGLTYTAFKERWFQRAWSGHGINPLDFAQEQIQTKLRDICLTLDAKDYFDLREPVPNVVRVTLPPKARAIYKDLERSLFAQLESGTEIEVLNAAALTNKCLQLANGAVYTSYPEWEAVHSAKLEALESIIEEAGGETVLVAYEFKSDVARIKKAFPHAVELRTIEGLRAFKAGHHQVGLAHPASMGHGIDGLQNVCRRLVRFGHNWNLEQRLQMIERIGPMRQLQAGLDRAVYVTDIIADRTLDDTVIARHTSKRKVQDLLLEAMKRV